MAAFLEKSTGSEGFHQVIDFLSQSHISYALTKKPEIYISFIKQFWRTAEASTDTDGEVTITAIIDGQSKTITEASLRRHLKLEDHDGITSIPNSEIFEQLALMGYHTDSDKLTFQKGAFHLNGDMQKKQLTTHSKIYPVPSLNNKVFSNMRRVTKGYTGEEIGLFPSMITSPTPESSPTPSRITSSPSLSSEPSTEPTIEPQPSPDAEYHVPTPNESPLHAVHSHGSAEGSLKLNELTTLVTKLSERIGVLEDDLKKTKLTYSAAVTKLILRVKKLETQVKAGTARKRARVVLSEDDEDVEDDSSKQGRKLSDAEVQEKASTETEPIIQEVTPTEVIQDQGSSEKGSAEISTAGATKATASEVPVVSTAKEDISTDGRTVTYRRRSEEQRTRKEKGKAIMTEPEPKKKSKKELEQERLSFAEAIRLEEQRAQIARDEEIARQQWDEEEGQRAMSEAKSSKKIDWNDPSVISSYSADAKWDCYSYAYRKEVSSKSRNNIKDVE
ncbi:hypothetical protein Tco_0806915 [Tanacetum coccineum]